MLKAAFIGPLTALLILLSFPPFHLSYLAWFSLVPYFYLVRSQPLRVAFWAAFFLGTTLFSGLLYWIVNYSWSVYLAVVGIGTLCCLIGTSGVRLLERRAPPVLQSLVPAFVWTSLEWLVHQYPFHLPLSFGLTQVRQSGVLQIASMTGSYGISFLLILSNSILVSFLKYWGERGFAHSIDGTQSNLIHRRGPAVGMLLLSGMIGLGYFLHFQGLMAHQAEENHLRVAVIQGNTPYWMLRSINAIPEFQRENEEAYFSLSRSAIESHPDLIVWPETAVRKYVMRVPELRNRLDQLAAESRSYLVLGSQDRDENGYHYNSAFVISPDGKTVGRYDKIYLAPSERDFISAKKLQPIRTPIGVLGITICFESTLPQVARSLVNQGSSLLFVLTNDAGFKKSPAPYFHADEAVLRAVENKSYVIRAANTGISQVIDPYGNVLTKSSLDRREVLYATVSTRRSGSIYSKVGDLFSHVCLGMLAVCIVFSFFTERTRRSKEGGPPIKTLDNIKSEKRCLRQRILRFLLTAGFTAAYISALITVSLVKVGYDNDPGGFKSFSIKQSARFVKDYLHDSDS